MVTGCTVNTDELKGNEMKATYSVAARASLYGNWVITQGNNTPLLGNKTVLLHQL